MGLQSSYSEPPININTKDSDRPVTFADVAMRIARDGPMYGVIILVAMLAITGKASALESIVGSALGLLARSWPGAVEVDKTAGKMRSILIMLAAAGGMALTSLLGACGPIGYGTSLVECNDRARTCQESIECENKWRASKGRALRDVDAGCK